MPKNELGLTREQVLHVMKHSNSNRHAARVMGVDKRTWKKYASMYYDDEGNTLYDKHSNQSGICITYKKGDRLIALKRPTAEDLINGAPIPKDLSPREIKAMVLKDKLLPAKCSCCGFAEQRISDQKIPLIISFRNNNRRDWTLENIELLCYNCYFIQIGDILTRKQQKVVEGFDAPEQKDVNHFMELSKVDFQKLEEMWAYESKLHNLSGEDLISRK